ncbi:MAG: DUF1461 domain-containing protein, partial [Candidatus Woesearchaeota archaeon]
DVRILILLCFLVTIVSLFVFSRLSIAERIKASYYASRIVFCIFLAIIFLVVLDFDTTFFVFHTILFWNDLWLLPANSVLIQSFPSDFFFTVSTGLFLILLCAQILLYVFIRNKYYTIVQSWSSK